VGYWSVAGLVAVVARTNYQKPGHSFFAVRKQSKL